MTSETMTSGTVNSLGVVEGWSGGVEESCLIYLYTPLILSAVVNRSEPRSYNLQRVLDR